MRVTHTSVAVAFALALAAGACSNNNREVPDPTDRAERALTDANIKDVNVDWDKEAKVAHLKGSVDSTRERERAAEVASTAVGTSGKVLNELTVNTEKTADDMDGRIRTELHDMINRDQVLRDRDIDFDVNNGMVTVKGDVRTTAEKAKVSELVKTAAGVKDFANALEIKPKP